MELEQAVAQHYAHGALEQTILAALAAAGKDVNRLSVKDLAPVDEFHIGGRPATVAFAQQLELKPGMRVLDIGCGLGGAARYFASEQGCEVAGIDLSEEYAQLANTLAQRAELGAKVSCHAGSALDLPYDAASFDAAYMLHVGMNIEGKQRLFAGIRRVLKPGGLFGIYDVMRLAAGDLSYPVPWASDPACSFVAAPAAYKEALQAAGFELLKERNRRDFALEMFAQMRAKSAGAGPAPLGLHLVMGPSAGQKVKNMGSDIAAGLIAPVEMICKVPD